MTEDTAEVVVIGAGPAGLSTSLNLARARRHVVLVDSNSPRHMVSHTSHGFITRDGTDPAEFRRLGRDEVEGYDEATVVTATVDHINRDGEDLLISLVLHNGDTHLVRTSHVVIATGLSESFPDVPSLSDFYGVTAHSCIECDGYEYAGQPLALLGETDDVGERAVLLSQWSDDLVVLTNGSGAVSSWWQAKLTERGIVVDDRPILDVEGSAEGVLSGVRFTDGEFLSRNAVFVRPHWTPNLQYAEELDFVRSTDGLIAVDNEGRTSVAGVWAIGDITPPGPQQLMIAAGSGQRLAATLNRTMLGLH